MHVNEAENGVVYLTWPAIEKIEGIRHAFSTRIGGVSKEHLSSMNLSFSRGDDPANVRENYRRFCEAAGFEVENIVTSDQAHTTKVRYVTKADCGSGVTRDRDFHDIDGMITDEPGVVLATLIGVPIGVYAAVRQYSLWDTIPSTLSTRCTVQLDFHIPAGVERSTRWDRQRSMRCTNGLEQKQKM